MDPPTPGGTPNQAKRLALVVLLVSISALLYLFIKEANDSPTYSTGSKSRDLSIDLGNGRCRYEPPLATVPVDSDYHKTLVVGFPSGGKRMVFSKLQHTLPRAGFWLSISDTRCYLKTFASANGSIDRIADSGRVGP